MRAARVSNRQFPSQATLHGMIVQQTSHPSWLCPDLLRYEQIGEADNLRGRVVRAFFWAMRAWPA